MSTNINYKEEVERYQKAFKDFSNGLGSFTNEVKKVTDAAKEIRVVGLCDGIVLKPISQMILDNKGGESGRNRCPFKLEWAYVLKKQCKDAGTPYFFKQIDKIKPIPPDLFIRQLPTKFEKDE